MPDGGSYHTDEAPQRWEWMWIKEQAQWNRNGVQEWCAKFIKPNEAFPVVILHFYATDPHAALDTIIASGKDPLAFHLKQVN